MLDRLKNMAKNNLPSKAQRIDKMPRNKK